MEKVLEKNGNITYIDGDKKYTMVNMGEYVGHAQREWYEQAPDAWRLMFYDEKTLDGILHMEALVDQYGDYSRFIIEQGKEKRVIQVTGDYIEEDGVYLFSEDGLFPEKEYKALERKFGSEPKESLNEYLEEDKEFVSSDGEKYEGVITSQEIVTEFLEKNKELTKEMSKGRAL